MSKEWKKKKVALYHGYLNNVFYYDENAIGDFVPNPSSQQIVVKNNWLNSSLNANEIRFKMERAEDGSSVFDYDEFGATESNGVFEISGFRYDTANFDFNSKSSFATLDLDNNGDIMPEVNPYPSGHFFTDANDDIMPEAV